MPGDVDALVSPSDKLSQRDHSELESSPQHKLLVSLSFVSDVTERVGLIGSSDEVLGLFAHAVSVVTV